MVIIMIKTIKKIDVCYSNASVIVTPVQNDAGSRFLVAVLTSEGERYDLPTGCTVQLAVRKPDSTETLTAAICENNTVVAELTNQTLAVKGIADAQIIICSGESVLKTPPFKLNIYEQIISDDTVESTDEFSALSSLLKNYQQVISAVENKLDKSGGTMSGNIDMGGNTVVNVMIPQNGGDVANKEYVDGATSGINVIKKIRRIELGAGETASQLTVSTDENNKPVNLNIAYITAHFIFEATDTNATIRIRTSLADGRYFILQSGVSRKSGSITAGGHATAFGGKIISDFSYQVGVNQGITKATGNYSTVSSGAIINANIPSVEAWLYDASNQYITLQAGSFLEVWGC